MFSNALLDNFDTYRKLWNSFSLFSTLFDWHQCKSDGAVLKTLIVLVVRICTACHCVIGDCKNALHFKSLFMSNFSLKLIIALALALFSIAFAHHSTLC